jgi:ADP-ribose pyrophosphatase YjhB (NUDIX family)
VSDKKRIALVVSALIEDEQKRLLMVREAQPEFYGLWNQPAGHVDPGEGIEEALLREVREETGYTHVRIDGIARVCYFPDEALLRVIYRASLVDRNTLPLADDVLEARWFTRQELEELKSQGLLRHERTEMAIQDWIGGTSADAGLIRSLKRDPDSGEYSILPHDRD